jgi:uncharacterized protein YjcR
MDKLIQMYMLGYTHVELCEAFGISPDTLRKRIKEYGLPRRRQPLSIDIEAFKNDYYSGISSYKLAETFGICRSTVTRLVKELKLRENEIATRRPQNPMECYAEI